MVSFVDLPSFSGVRARSSGWKSAHTTLDITVLWQAKAWNNAQTQLAYDDLVLIPELKAAGVGIGRPGFEVEGFAFSDNLSAHKQHPKS